MRKFWVPVQIQKNLPAPHVPSKEDALYHRKKILSKLRLACYTSIMKLNITSFLLSSLILCSLGHAESIYSMPEATDDLSQKAQAAQDQLMNNEEAMMELQELVQDPEIAPLLADPELVRIATSNDVKAIANNPKAQALINNPKMRALMEKVRATTPAQ